MGQTNQLNRSAREVADRLTIMKGDITKQRVDAIVNSADPSLLGGGGVDGAIHRAAGPGLLRECRGLGGCATGEARATGGYHLPAKWVIHTVGPVWEGGVHGEDGALANCYRNSLRMAVKVGAKTVAFPSISTGIYWFPVERAAAIAVREIIAHLQREVMPESVVMVCFNDRTLAAYSSALAAMTNR